jgi:DNA-binding NarL/FixJ family response regulator
MQASQPLRVLVVASRTAGRAGLRRRLTASGIATCAEAADGPAAAAAVCAELPDLCVVDAAAPLEPIAAITQLLDAAPDVPVVVLGDDADDATLLACVTAGAAGYLSREPSDRLGAALRDVAAGRPAYPRRLTTLLIESLQRDVAP